MGIGRQNIFIRRYIVDMAEDLKKKGFVIPDEELEKLLDEFSEKRLGTLELIHEVNDKFKEILEDYNKQKDLIEAYMEKIEVNKELEDLPLEYSGITLNKQDIDLMRIEDSSTPEELSYSLETVSNLSPTIEKTKLTDKEFLEAKRKSYELYQTTLVDQNEEIKDPSIKTRKKIEYLKDSGELTEEEKEKIDNILQNNTSEEEIVENVNQEFGEEKSHRIYEILRECSPVEKSGIKKMTPEASGNLLDHIKQDYNSITIDEKAKYCKVVLQDGTCDFRDLQKCLDFAKDLGKQVRLNALIFYMDCPEKLYNLDTTPENKIIVKDSLTKYVDEITRFISDNGYTDTVRSIDIFNELPNRFPMSGDVPYQYRGDIPQSPDQGEKTPDNIAAGWQKYLTVDDLCDVASVARKNLPDTDFMYNDDNLIDPDKLKITSEIITKIQKYEQEHGIKLIDSIGTQMHVDNDVTAEEIEYMFKELSKFGLPIEVTEFDLAMTKNIDDLSDEEIEIMRQIKMNEIISCIESLKEECNIRGLTIWSKTDSQNFRVRLANEELINAGEEPIETLHGGYYTEDMESKSKQLVKTNNYNYHTHTSRCGHASDTSDEEYINSAKESGITTLGFSDYAPNPELEYEQENTKMHVSEVDDYLESIEELKEENPDMEILSGFEAEYDPSKEGFLSDLREKVDCMILGQHFLRDGIHKVDSNVSNYPITYAESVCRALETGIFDIVAHPDIFFKERDNLSSNEEKQLFDENSAIASRMICEKAKEMNIPVELNLLGQQKGNNYPNKIFWDIASETQVRVVVGSDAHDPKQLETMYEDELSTRTSLGNPTLNMVDNDYNPKNERKKNERLQQAFKNTKEESISYDTYIIIQLIEKIMDSKEEDIQIICNTVSDKLIQLSNNEDINNKINKIDNEDEIKKIKSQLQSKHYSDTLKKRQEVLLQASESVKKAATSCSSKDEILDFVRKDMEKKRKPKTSSEVNTMLNDTKTQSTSNYVSTKDNPKVLQYQNNSNKNADNNLGYVETMSLYTSLFIVLIILFFIILLLT